MGKRDKRLERDYEGKFTSFKRRVKNFFKICLLIVITIGIGTSIFAIGGLLNPRLQYEKVEAIKEVELEAPIMDKIADCETGQRLPNGKAKAHTAKHFSKSGQVVMTGNNNKSVDVGKYAINSIWFSKATELGYDLTNEDDNKSMAYWIYKNRGTDDWSASANCWRK